MLQPPEGFQPPDGTQMPEGPQPPFDAQPPDGMQQSLIKSILGSSYSLPVLAGSIVFLMAGLIFVIKFKRVKYF